MERRDFLQAMGLTTLGIGTMATTMGLQDLTKVTDTFAPSERMPLFFIGHGDPMNALRDNQFTRSLQSMGASIEPRPKAILVVSAHWLTRGTFVAHTSKPETIYDFGGFPDELYQVKYPAAGAPELAEQVSKLKPDTIKLDDEWGFDHGAWTVLKHMFPGADIPVFQLSINYHQPMQYHYDLARELRSMREKGVLVIGSGNIVHNLRMAFANGDFNSAPYDWTVEFDTFVHEKLTSGDHKALIEYEKHGQSAKLSVPTVDHYVPMLYTLGLAHDGEPLVQTYEELMSSISMRCFRIG